MMLSFKDYLKEKCQSQESPKNKHFTVQLRCKVVILNRFHLKCNLINLIICYYVVESKQAKSSLY